MTREKALVEVLSAAICFVATEREAAEAAVMALEDKSRKRIEAAYDVGCRWRALMPDDFIRLADSLDLLVLGATQG